ncbi:MAG: transporter [Acetobacteraceae bacterium]|nr:transporter [Acetobacteraceae bacterium]
MAGRGWRACARASGTLAALAAGTWLGIGDARASGFALREGSADWMANAFAGNTAKAYDASTAYNNPAGMVRLDQNELDASVNGIFPSIHFTGTNRVGPALTPGTTDGNLIEPAATAGTFGVWSYSPDLKFGFGATAPFGQRVDNPTDFVGRYQSLVSSITDISFQLSAAYRVTDRFSIGGGPVIDYFNTRLTQAQNIGVNALTGDPVGNAYGDDVGIGFDIGAMYQIDEGTRAGINYRSRISHRVSGSQYVYVPPLLAIGSPATAALLSRLDSSANADVTLPDNVSVGLYHDITPRWAVMSDLQWTHWSLLKEITVVPTSGAPTTNLPQNWQSTWFVSIGTNYRVLENLMLQTGFSYDQSPVRDLYRTTRVPDSDRYNLGVGLTWSVLPNVNLQAAYLHTFFASAPINSSASPSAGVIQGKYSVDANSVSLGATVKF